MDIIDIKMLQAGSDLRHKKEFKQLAIEALAKLKNKTKNVVNSIISEDAAFDILSVASDLSQKHRVNDERAYYAVVSVYTYINYDSIHDFKQFYKSLGNFIPQF